MRRVATETSLADAAIRYAHLGIPVFPCVPGGKQPLTPNGFHDATSSARVVHAWWERTPDANIGLPTGPRTGVLVVDVDIRGSASGFEAFERARSERLADRWGWLVRTPSGGVHAYYPSSGDQEQRSWQVPSAHVDFRGDGGYVIAPPSRIEVDGAGKAYDVIAVTTQPARTVDAVKLRQFFEPARPRRILGQPAELSGPHCHPPALARTVALTPRAGATGRSSGRRVGWSRTTSPRPTSPAGSPRPRSTRAEAIARSRPRSTPQSTTPPGSAR
jgi:hypothetical protein